MRPVSCRKNESPHTVGNPWRFGDRLPNHRELLLLRIKQNPVMQQHDQVMLPGAVRSWISQSPGGAQSIFNPERIGSLSPALRVCELRWVCHRRVSSTLKELNLCAPGTRHLMQLLQSCEAKPDVTQGSSLTRNPGLNDEIPLGFEMGARRGDSKAEQVPPVHKLVVSIKKITHRVIDVRLPFLPWSAQPCLVIAFNELRNRFAWDDMKTRSLSWGTQPNKHVVMIRCKERLALLTEHPLLVPDLIGLALNGYRTCRIFVRRENVDAPRVSK